jgi:hypothetical protein
VNSSDYWSFHGRQTGATSVVAGDHEIGMDMDALSCRNVLRGGIMALQ